MQYHSIPCSTMQYRAIPCNTSQYSKIPCNTMQCHTITCNTMQYNAIPCIINNCWRSVPLPCGQYKFIFVDEVYLVAKEKVFIYLGKLYLSLKPLLARRNPWNLFSDTGGRKSYQPRKITTFSLAILTSQAAREWECVLLKVKKKLSLAPYEGLHFWSLNGLTWDFDNIHNESVKDPSIWGENEHYYQIQALSSILLSAHGKQHAWKRCYSRLDECLGWADLIRVKSQCPKNGCVPELFHNWVWFCNQFTRIV